MALEVSESSAVISPLRSLRVVTFSVTTALSSTVKFNYPSYVAITGKLTCVICQTEATPFRIDNQVPKSLEIYLKPPISLLEDSISVFTVA